MLSARSPVEKHLASYRLTPSTFVDVPAAKLRMATLQALFA